MNGCSVSTANSRHWKNSANASSRVYEETGSLRTPEADLTPEQRQLRDLESELSSALALYSESQPTGHGSANEDRATPESRERPGRWRGFDEPGAGPSTT